MGTFGTWGGVAALAALGLVACSHHAPDAVTGYVEADYVRPAPASGGRLTAVSVERGATVAAGQSLFSLDAEREQASVAEARHRLDGESARLADLEKGGRPEELAVIRAQLRQAEAASKLSHAVATRQRELVQKNLTPRESLDTAAAAETRDTAQVEELRHQLDVAGLAGRADAVEAARQDVAAATAQLAQAQWSLDQKSVAAPAAGSIEDVYFRSGEWVNAGVPVLALLPPSNRRVRFYVPQQALTQFAAGTAITLRCDGCGEPVPATVRFVASEAEFAPPVLFDRRQRSRLVYRVEAVPDVAVAPRLHPGQPVDVSRAGG